MSDIALQWQNGKGYGDIVARNNDLLLDESIETAVVLSFFTDGRASADEEIPDGSTDRRGYWGDHFNDGPDESEGSLFWLLERGLETDRNLQRARKYGTSALAWMLADNVAKSVSVDASYPQHGLLQVSADIVLARGETVSVSYLLTTALDAVQTVDGGTPGEIQGAPGAALDRPAATQAPLGDSGEIQGASGYPPVAADPFAPGAAGVPGEVAGAEGTPPIVAAPYAPPPAGSPGEVGCVCAEDLTADTTLITVDTTLVTADQG